VNLREARIDLSAITRNVETLRRIAQTDHTMVVVKADGYGHGAIESARAAVAGGADWLGVVDLEEAMQLRAAGLSVPVLTWMHAGSADFSAATAAQIDLGVNSLEQLERVAAASGVARVHLKVDTGLGRNGVTEAECAPLFARAAALEAARRVRVVGFFSHLSNTGPTEDLAQVESFALRLAEARDAGLDPEFVHLAATAAAIDHPAARHSLVRIGVGAYGLSPFDDRTSADLGLIPAMELGASVLSVKRVPAGTGVSYGYTYRTASESNLVLVPLGYADGIPRAASSAGPVSIDSCIHRVSGRIAMDQFVVDVGDQAVHVGDRVVLFGDPANGVPSATDWAAAAGTINYEIVTRIGPRVPRVYSS
jgi:alanine racemase